MRVGHRRLLLWSIYPIVLLLPCGTTTVSPRLNITVGIFGINTPFILSSLPYALPGFLEGLSQIGTRYDFHINTTILTGNHSKVVRDCNELLQYMYLVPQFYYNRPKDGSLFLLLHSGCFEIYELSAMSLEWNTLIFSSSGTVSSTQLSSLDVFHNEISSSLVDMQQLVVVLQNLLQYFSWSTVAIVRDNDALFNPLADVLTVFNEKARDKLSIKTFTLSNVSSMENGVLLSRIKRHARIVLLLMNGVTVRDFLSRAYNASMTNGEYVYISIHPFYNERRYGKLAWRRNKTDDVEAREAFRSLLFVTSNCHGKQATNQTRMAKFKSDSIRNYGGIYGENEEPANAFFMYELVKLGGQVLDAALKAGMNVSDGFAISNLFRERSFLVDGRVVKTDKYNRVLFDYCVKKFDPDDDTWPTSALRYDAKDRKFVALNGTAIDWNNPENRPPPNEPYCGFTGTRAVCLEYNPLSLATSAWHWGSAIFGLFLILLVAGLYYRRRAHRNTEGPWWLITIEYCDIHELNFARSGKIRFSISYRHQR